MSLAKNHIHMRGKHLPFHFSPSQRRKIDASTLGVKEKQFPLPWVNKLSMNVCSSCGGLKSRSTFSIRDGPNEGRSSFLFRHQNVRWVIAIVGDFKDCSIRTERVVRGGGGGGLLNECKSTRNAWQRRKFTLHSSYQVCGQV